MIAARDLETLFSYLRPHDSGANIWCKGHEKKRNLIVKDA